MKILSLMMLTLLSQSWCAPLLENEGVSSHKHPNEEEDVVHEHPHPYRDERVFNDNQFSLGDISVPGHITGDDVSIGSQVKIEIHTHSSMEPLSWEQFKMKHNRTYQDVDTEKRRKITWSTHAKKIKEHNEQFKAGNVSHRLAGNEFMDLTHHEFDSQMKGFRPPPQSEIGQVADFSKYSLDDLPDSVDWRAKGYVTSVKNQNPCSTCWAFGAAGALEGQHFKKTGQLISLSAQNLVDCAYPDTPNYNCRHGGWPQRAFKYVVDNGISSAASYPYIDAVQPCQSKEPTAATTSDYMTVRGGSEEDLQKAVALVGPVAVVIDATGYQFRFYSGQDDEVFYNAGCSSSELDHVVLVVGYGSRNGQDYWIVKNSWGQTWGKEGYIYMARNKENNCGIASAASFPVDFGNQGF